VLEPQVTTEFKKASKTSFVALAKPFKTFKKRRVLN
jgi:hypothetical protein